MHWYDGMGWYYDAVLAANYVLHIYLLNFYLLLLPWSFLETMLNTTTLFSLVLIEFVNSTISLAISPEFVLPGTSLVPIWIIIWAGYFSCVGFT